LVLNKIAEKRIAEGKAKKISIKEARKILRIANEEGLVHMTATKPRENVSYMDEKSASKNVDDDASNWEFIYAVCSCCPCCCYGLQALSKYSRKDMTVRSEYVAQDNPGLCTNCGDCIERCVFGSREMKDGEMIHNPDECYGCGLCVTACPTNTITMKIR
jgi:ferredoxin